VSGFDVWGRLWGMMAAVAKLKQAVKSAVEDREQQQRINAQQMQHMTRHLLPLPLRSLL